MNTFSALHAKFAASSMLPVPLYLATCGCGQSGRVRVTFPAVIFDASIRCGSCPLSTQESSALIMSNVSGPSPPPQWPIPGTIYRRNHVDPLAGAFVAPSALV